MSRDVIPLTIDDLSDFAKRLRASLQESDDIPGHLAFLGHISRAAGYQNYQHLKATNAKPVPLSDPAQPGQRPSDQPAPRALERALRSFDGTGVMSHWPKAYSAQALAMWAFWDALPGRVDLTESEVNDVLRARSSFGDHVLLRRSLIDHGMQSAVRTEGSIVGWKRPRRQRRGALSRPFADAGTQPKRRD